MTGQAEPAPVLNGVVPSMEQQYLLWGGFLLFVVAMLALDLGVFHRKAHVIHMREALASTAVWITLDLVFNAGIAYFGGLQAGVEFLKGISSRSRSAWTTCSCFC